MIKLVSILLFISICFTFGCKKCTKAADCKNCTKTARSDLIGTWVQRKCIRPGVIDSSDTVADASLSTLVITKSELTRTIIAYVVPYNSNGYKIDPKEDLNMFCTDSSKNIEVAIKASYTIGATTTANYGFGTGVADDVQKIEYTVFSTSITPANVIVAMLLSRDKSCSGSTFIVGQATDISNTNCAGLPKAGEVIHDIFKVNEKGFLLEGIKNHLFIMAADRPTVLDNRINAGFKRQF